LRLSGSLLLRFDESRLSDSLLLNEPPRSTRERVGRRRRLSRGSKGHST
jgi:hypothetical protein